MSVDSKKERVVLVVHGVQIGSGDNLQQHEKVKQLIEGTRHGNPVQYRTELYAYENINNQAQKKFSSLIGKIAQTPIQAVAAKVALDLIGDVVIARLDGSTAATIRSGLKEKIHSFFANGNPCYLVGHSLGSVYVLDVVNELMKDRTFFDRNDRTTWPIQGMVTIGSPLGLGMFRNNRRKIQQLGNGLSSFRWDNYWDPTDPVVSGRIFGTQLQGTDVAQKYLNANEDAGWAIFDVPMDTGKQWLLSHTAYWDHPTVGHGIVNQLIN